MFGTHPCFFYAPMFQYWVSSWSLIVARYSDLWILKLTYRKTFFYFMFILTLRYFRVFHCIWHYRIVLMTTRPKILCLILYLFLMSFGDYCYFLILILLFYFDNYVCVGIILLVLKGATRTITVPILGRDKLVSKSSSLDSQIQAESSRFLWIDMITLVIYLQMV